MAGYGVKSLSLTYGQIAKDKDLIPSFAISRKRGIGCENGFIVPLPNSGHASSPLLGFQLRLPFISQLINMFT
jgi:hypothetical protein